MTRKEFDRQMKLAAKIVSSWPVWKQRLLEQSAKPFVEKPREPVMNRRCSRNLFRQHP